MTESNFQIESAAVSDRGLSEKRPQNEDSFIEINERGLFAVADGVGGAQAGDVASQMAVEVLGEAFRNLQTNGDAEEMMKIAIERANEAIFQMSHDLAQLSTMATTVVALHVAGNIATIGHVGDSRIYRLDPKGNFYRETQDHSVVEEEVRAGRMTAEQAATHPSRNVISRALGADSTVEVDMKTIMFEPNTTFLLCSDGITRHIDDFQLREMLSNTDNPADIVQRMKQICYERGAEDNLTAVIARVTDKVVKNRVAAAVAVKDDLEEATVANARPAIVPETLSADDADDDKPTQPLHLPVTAALPPIAAVLPPPVAEVPANPDALSFRAAEENKIETNDAPVERKTETVREKSGIGSLLSSLLWLIIGGLLGAGIYYFLSSNNQPEVKPVEVPPLTQMQTKDPDYISFENLRRQVDKDPNTYINTNADTTQDAEGLYLLGRAYLLNQKYPEAKKAFEDAKDNLAKASAVNQKVLEHEIAIGLAIVNDAAAQREMQKQLAPQTSLPNPQAGK